MSIIDLKTSFKASILSYFGVAISPMLMIGVYLFSFYASGDEINTIELPYYSFNQSLSYTNNFKEFSKIGWLIIGVLSWSYIGSVVTFGSNSTRTYSGLISKVGTPICIPPMLVTLSKTFVGIVTIIVSGIIYMIIASIEGEKIISINILQMPFLLLLLFCFMSFGSLIFAPLTAISKDFFNIIGILPIFLQGITGVFLPLSKDNMNSAIGIIFRVNPFNFLIDNLRGSIIGNSFFGNDGISLISFISFFILFLFAAIIINKRARRVVVDLV